MASRPLRLSGGEHHRRPPAAANTCVLAHAAGCVPEDRAASAVLAQSGAGICRLDKHCVAQWDDTAGRLLGFDGEGRGQFLDLLQPEDRGAFANYLARKIIKSGSECTELPIKCE